MGELLTSGSRLTRSVHVIDKPYSLEDTMNVWSSNRFALALACGASFWELPDWRLEPPTPEQPSAPRPTTER